MQTNPRTSPIPCACPHCGGAAELQPTAVDRADFACPRCGEFSISGTDAALIEQGALAYADMRFPGRDGRALLTRPSQPAEAASSAAGEAGWARRLGYRPLMVGVLGSTACADPSE